MQDATIDAILNSIHHGDCIAALHKMPAGFVDLAFADPPFNIGYEYDVYDDKKERADYLEWSKQWISAVYRVLKPSGTFWLAIGDEYAAELKVLSQEIGFHCRSWVVWYYTFGVNCTKKFSRSHAHLFHFVKDPEQFTFRGDHLENRVPSARQLVYADARANPRGRLPDDTWVLRPQDLADCFTPAEDTWYFPRVAGTFKERAGFHGCQMPEQLLGRIIRTCSHEGDVVLDPFSGSATTLVVAKKLGRRFLGVEISDEYVRRGTERLDSVRRGDPLEGAPEPVVSAPPTPNQRSARQSGATSKTSAAVPRSPEPLRKPESKIKATIQHGLIEALRCVSRGFSLDRVIADPQLNAQLADACLKLALPGDIRSWNRMLFRIRKAGKLADIPTQQRTEISWADCDEYLFASEIALKQLLDQGCGSIDEILCDPVLAQEFDRMAQSLAPGFSSLQYRWAALKLRKEAKVARTRAQVLTPIPLGKPTRLDDPNWASVPDGAGIYLVTGMDGKLKVYGGGAMNLRRRLGGQFGSCLLDRWKNEWAADLVAFAVTSQQNATELLAYQSFLVREHRPRLNCLELAVA
jgi:site-specific DNA-methyltransferase (adenine-specific)